MVVIGLTGSIGMGKTNAGRKLRYLGVPVHDADAAVHALLGTGGAAVGPVAAVFPEARRGDAIDRATLARLVFGDPPALARLERILHPLVRARTARFLRQAARRGARLVVLDVPLLFETGGERLVDLTAVVSAPPLIQRQRVLRRPGMTPERLSAILARQMPDRLKRRRADRVILTGLDYGRTLQALADLVRLGHKMKGRAWAPGAFRQGLRCARSSSIPRPRASTR